MRLLVQRVGRAEVRVAGAAVGTVGSGLLVLAGFGRDDGPDLPGSPVWRKMIDKLLNLRIFSDDQGKLNRSLTDTGGGLLLVSQFTLYADCRKGRRPSFDSACPPDTARALYDALVRDLGAACPGPFATGEFGADMELDFVNDGPVTILLDSVEM